MSCQEIGVALIRGGNDVGSRGEIRERQLCNAVRYLRGATESWGRRIQERDCAGRRSQVRYDHRR